MGVHDTQLGQLIGNFDTLMTGLAGSRAQIGSAIDNLSTAESATSNLLNEAQPTLNEDIQTLSHAVQSLSANQKGLERGPRWVSPVWSPPSPGSRAPATGSTSISAT